MRAYPGSDHAGFVLFAETAFSGESRHARRLAMITDHEATGELPGCPPIPGPGRP